MLGSVMAVDVDAGWVEEDGVTTVSAFATFFDGDAAVAGGAACCEGLLGLDASCADPRSEATNSSMEAAETAPVCA